MSGSNAAAAKARLIGESSILLGLSGMSGVVISYDPPRDTPRELVTAASDVAGSVELDAFEGDDGRVRRSEELSMELEVRVYRSGQKTREQGDARAVEISNVIEEYVAANSELGGLPGLRATVDRFRLSGFLDEEGATSVVTLTIGLVSFLD